MQGILDRLARISPPAKQNQFTPKSPQEYFALQLAARCNEPAAAQHYADLLGHHGMSQLLTAYRRGRSRGSHTDPARSFHDELRRLGDREDNSHEEPRQIAAIRVDRRALAVVILADDHLEYPPLVRQLSSDASKAQSSAAGFISRVMQKCPFKTAAMETLPCDAEVQRQALMKTIGEVLSEQAVSLWPVPRAEILKSFAYPEPRFRSQVHDIVETIWPNINGSFGAPLVRDALALGLYCQTEYLFNL
jgi:hypothetical protein